MSRDQFVWIETFMAALSGAGVRDLVVCPGSRSTPLVLAAEATNAFTCHRAVDERAAAFFALGQARITGKPSAVLCTSGTAAAHFFPAVIEAAQSFVPLLLLTADRPWELVGVAAPQTMDQRALFGMYARGFFELGEHDASLPDAVAQRVAAQAAARCWAPTPGPVHVNVRLRKPLEPSVPWPDSNREAVKPTPKSWFFPPQTSPSPQGITLLTEHVARARRGIIVCGPTNVDHEREPLRVAAVALAKATGFVLFAETTSQARFGKAEQHVIECPSFDVVLRSPAVRKALAPQVIVELGAPPTSTNYAEFVAQHASVPRFVVAEHGWNDPAQDATALIFADPAAVCRAVVDRLFTSSQERVRPDESWRSFFQRMDARVWSLAEKHAGTIALTEAVVARTVVAKCPKNAVLVVGNSLPVRDVDVWAPPRRTRIDVVHQRGVSGIDGLIAGATGTASVAHRPVVLLLGDTSALHDLTSLALARHVAGPLVIVVVQNQGGRIFERLPVARAVDRARFDKYFTMHEPVDLEEAAAAFGVEFARTDHTETFVQLFDAALGRNGTTLLEAVVLPGDGTARMARFCADVGENLRAFAEEVDE